MSFASNYFYAYQGAVNTAYFDGPTRALNAVLEAAGAIIGALLIGYCVLDVKGVHRRTRGYLGLGLVTGMVIIIWLVLRYTQAHLLLYSLFVSRAVGLSWQVTFTRADVGPTSNFVPISYHDASYKGKGALYFFCECGGTPFSSPWA